VPFFCHTFRKRPTFYQDHRERHQFELSRPVSQDTTGWCLFSPLATRFPNGAAEFQTLPFVLSHGSRKQSIIAYRKIVFIENIKQNAVKSHLLKKVFF